MQPAGLCRRHAPREVATSETPTIPADVLTILDEQDLPSSKANVFFGNELVSTVSVGAESLSISAFSYVPFVVAVK